MNQISIVSDYGRIEREQILSTLLKTKGNRKKAAKLLGISRSTLYRRLQRTDMNAIPQEYEEETLNDCSKL